MKILFACHGNICRSPMAEFVMNGLLVKTGRDDAVVGFASSRFKVAFARRKMPGGTGGMGRRLANGCAK